MEAAFRLAWAIFGPVVATWTIDQLRSWAAENMGGMPPAQGYPQGGCSCDSCAALRSASCRAGAQLDPDSGCFYWDLPLKEQ